MRVGGMENFAPVSVHFFWVLNPYTYRKENLGVGYHDENR